MRHHTWDLKTGSVPVSTTKRMLFGLNLKKTVFFHQKSDQRAGRALGSSFVCIWSIPRTKSGDRSNLARRSVVTHQNRQIRTVLEPCDWPVDGSHGRLAILYGYRDRWGVRGAVRARLVAIRPSPTTRADARARYGRQHGFLLWFPGMMGISVWDTQASELRESLPGSCCPSASFHRRDRSGRLIPASAQGPLPRMNSLASID